MTMISRMFVELLLAATAPVFVQHGLQSATLELVAAHLAHGFRGDGLGPGQPAAASCGRAAREGPEPVNVNETTG